MKEYFDAINSGVIEQFKIAQKAREKKLDPEDYVEIQLTKNMAERVVGLISVIAPQIKDSGVVERIIELEKEFGILDWRVCLQIALEIAQQKYCKFNDQKEAIEVGIRTGFAYSTVGVVSSPIEGFTHIDIKDRYDRKGKYFCINFAGPIRNAGGTNAALCVLIADYVRKKLGFSKYDPNEQEIKRCYTELCDYHERVTNLQYFPSEEETIFLMKNIPIEIGGEPSEKVEVSNYKDIPRIPTNYLRSGYCLLHSSCIPLKAPKLWKQISKWGKEFDMDDWNFLGEFCELQKKMKTMKKLNSEESKSESILTPSYTYIADIVAGRPVLSHPLASGGLRLRYGRARTTGYSACGLHPATMLVLNSFIGNATHIKLERPSKGAAITSCSTIEGPIVKLENGNVIFLETEALAKQHKKEIKEILYLGDILISYGDFFNRAHPLVPAGYCEEWWIKEFEKACVTLFGTLDFSKLAEFLSIDESTINKIYKKYMIIKPSAEEALTISKKMNIPLHPYYTYHFSQISIEKAVELLEALRNSTIQDEKLIMKNEPQVKRALEIIGVPHINASNEFIVIEKPHSKIIFSNLILSTQKIDNIKKTIPQFNNTIDFLNSFLEYKIRDKSGTFIGARMGRPEKAKIRKLKGNPHGLFPVGAEGGRMRSFQAAMQAGKVRSDFPIFFCNKCEKETIFKICEECRTETTQKYYCDLCGIIDTKTCAHGNAKPFRKKDIDINNYINNCLDKLQMKTAPDLIKGVKGTFSDEHVPEHPIKAILRAKHELYVNKDGTVRYDSSEVPITHFKPKEIGVSIERLKSLGYEKDIKGAPLEEEDQILQLLPQDIILPCSPESPDEPADEILFRTGLFIDELLEKFYGLPAFYNFKSKEDLVGVLVLGLAPHTSAAAVGRIIGFSKTQGFLAHPVFHAAMRRDCDGDESCILLVMDAFLNFSRKYLPGKRGSTMDAPLVVTPVINIQEVDDMVFDLDIAYSYPLELYTAALEFKKPWDVKVKQISSVLLNENPYLDLGFTHDTENLNMGVLCSAYKKIPSMEDKMKSQMELAEKIRAVDENDVARLVIEKHFLKDIRGNLRKFSQQKFRCSKCNESYRRPPLLGACLKCNGNIIFTISEGFITKYLEPSLSLAKKYAIPEYLKQTLELTKRLVEGNFGREKEKQTGLKSWFG